MTPDARVQEIREWVKNMTWPDIVKDELQFLLSTLDARERRIEELESHVKPGHDTALDTLLGRLVEAAAEYRRLSNCFKIYPDRFREEWWKAGALLLDALTDARRALGERG